MRSGTAIVRVEDGKEFSVIYPAHWSTIRAADGEEDSVKWYGGDDHHEFYASNSKGFTYKVSKS